jgi:hypothetical protein
MPSIEIICIGQAQPSDFSRLPFAVEAETQLRSHRGSSSLFQQDFDRVQGCIYHLGNPYLKDPDAPGAYFASQLLVEWWERLEFQAEYIPSVNQLLEALLTASPGGRVLFTSDYQFGPRPRRRFVRWRTLDEFWTLHDTKRLHMNALYSLMRSNRDCARYPEQTTE